MSSGRKPSKISLYKLEERSVQKILGSGDAPFSVKRRTVYESSSPRVVRKHAVSAMDLEEDIHRIVIHPVSEELA